MRAQQRARLSCITALGRPEFDYLRVAAANLAPIAERHRLEWLVACDGVDAGLAREATADFPVVPIVLSSLEAGNTSAGETRNRALAVATGALTLTLDNDDHYLPEAMLNLIDIASSGAYPYAAGLANDINPDGSFRSDPPFSGLETGPTPPGVFFAHWKNTGHWPWHPSATVVRTDLLRHIGGWPGRGPLRDDEDTFAWSSITRRTAGFFTRDVVMSYRVHPASVTHQPEYRSGNEVEFERAWRRADALAARRRAVS